MGSGWLDLKLELDCAGKQGNMTGSETIGNRANRSHHIELLLTAVAAFISLFATVLIIFHLGHGAIDNIISANVVDVLVAICVASISLAFLYANLAYFLSRIGCLIRHARHVDDEVESLLSVYDANAPSVTVLVPSYKEDKLVVTRALLSAALAEYPSKRIALLIDDDPSPAEWCNAQDLAQMRELSKELETLLAPIRDEFSKEFLAYSRRLETGVDYLQETERLSRLYQSAANWLRALAREWPANSHEDKFFVERVLREPAKRHQEHARTLAHAESLGRCNISREYKRLAGLFNAAFSSFERKSFANLSHEPNKAMNLNSYLTLMGQAWRIRTRNDEKYLEPGAHCDADMSIPRSDYVVTLDADSVILNDYIIRLVRVMESPGNERLAVAQTPYSAFPGTKTLLERTAGATTDIQYFIHQGFTHFGATYWVGANALIRWRALDAIATQRTERGFSVKVYVQDTTVIEDTESSIDLIEKGWELYNYPERLAYSATPSDFGSLLIQRRRWANGGLIILPKLFRVAFSRPTKNVLELFLRAYYLVSMATTSAAVFVLMALPFKESMVSVWLPLAGAPYFLLYARDLVRAGYNAKDIVGVYALNILLIPVHLGGAGKSLQQVVTGRKSPFGRTPKVHSRTVVPPIYIWITACVALLSLFGFIHSLVDGNSFRLVFSLINFLMLLFVVSNFIGFRNFFKDAFVRCPRPRTWISRLDPPSMREPFTAQGVPLLKEKSLSYAAQIPLIGCDPTLSAPHTRRGGDFPQTSKRMNDCTDSESFEGTIERQASGMEC